MGNAIKTFLATSAQEYEALQHEEELKRNALAFFEAHPYLMRQRAVTDDIIHGKRIPDWLRPRMEEFLREQKKRKEIETEESSAPCKKSRTT